VQAFPPSFAWDVVESRSLPLPPRRRLLRRICDRCISPNRFSPIAAIVGSRRAGNADFIRTLLDRKAEKGTFYFFVSFRAAVYGVRRPAAALTFEQQSKRCQGTALQGGCAALPFAVQSAIRNPHSALE